MAAVKSSLIRLFRTPVRTFLFFLLLAFTAALVCAGGSLWKLCGDNLKRFEEIFMTIGTVEQTPERTEQTAIWYADDEAYHYYNRARYGETVSASVLNFEGAGYLSGPEQRAYYEALPLDYKVKEDNEGFYQYMIIEASPLEDCVPAGPVKIEVKRVLFSVYPVNVSPIYLCDHNTEHPQKLYADKTYLMALGDGFAHDWEEKGSAAIFEYVPIEGPYSTQADAEGKRLPTDLTGDWIAEVTPGFYETTEGKAWLQLCEDCEMRTKFFPVTATQDLNLIMAFYRKQAYLAEGELFSEEDYSRGNKVCLVPDRFARRNGLQVGDPLHLALRYANYAASPGRGGGEGKLNAAGEVYEVFEESDYTIKGIYDVGVAGDEGDWGYQLDRNEVFIPTASIRNSSENNIALYGPMKGYTTAFRIPNGNESIENYKRLWEEQGVDHVEITFYDGGYTKLEGGLASMRNLSLLLLATGSVSAAGAFAGQEFAQQAAAGMEQTALFDTRFSNGEVQLERERKEGETGNGKVTATDVSESEDGTESQGTYLTAADWRMSVVCGGSVFLFTLAAATVGIFQNLKQEPLMLLASAEKE